MLSMMATQIKGPPGLKLVIRCPGLKVASITSTQSSWVEPLLRQKAESSLIHMPEGDEDQMLLTRASDHHSGLP